MLGRDERAVSCSGDTKEKRETDVRETSVEMAGRENCCRACLAPSSDSLEPTGEPIDLCHLSTPHREMRERDKTAGHSQVSYPDTLGREQEGAVSI